MGGWDDGLGWMEWIKNKYISTAPFILVLFLPFLILESEALRPGHGVLLLVIINQSSQRHETFIHIHIVFDRCRHIPKWQVEYLILFLRHHQLISAQLTLRSRSDLLPTKMIMALSAFILQRSYHCSLIFLKELSRDKSKTIRTPWQPLKQVETIDRYFYWPAVSQIYNFAGLSLKTIFFILKSMVVTCVSFSARKSPSVKRQNSAVFPTLLSPTIITLQRFSSLLLLRYRSYIIQNYKYDPHSTAEWRDEILFTVVFYVFCQLSNSTIEKLPQEMTANKR